MTDMSSRIQEQQLEWSAQFKGRTEFTNYEDNLFEELKPDAKNEYANGDDHELTSHMYSPISSSALCCNFFYYWRYRDTRDLCVALGIGGNILQLRFEAKPEKPAGIGGRNPNIDVLIASDDGKLTAIECKFTEPYKSLSPRAQATMPLVAEAIERGLTGDMLIMNAVLI